MGRWTQYDEDSYRLPEGVTRVAYDADSARYTYRDRNGQIYQGNPGQQYGTLEPIGSPAPHRKVFEAEQPRIKVTINNEGPARTFEDFLPPSAITSPTAFSENPSPVFKTSPHSPSTSQPPKSHSRDHSTSRFVSAVRRTAVPKMQEVVKRSLTMARTPREKGTEPLLSRRDRGRVSEGVLRSNTSQSSKPLISAQGKVARSATTASISSRRSVETAMSTASTLTPMSVNASVGRSRSSASARSGGSSSTRVAVPM